MKANSGKSAAKDTQNLIIILSWFVYSAAYFGRYSFSSSINSIIENFSVSRAQTGLVGTFFFVAYGVGQVVNGFLCKKYNPRLVFPLALGGSALINVLVFVLIKSGFMAQNFFVLKYMWMLNGVVQSFIWTSIIYIFGENIEQVNMARAGAAIGTTVPAGTFIAYSSGTLMEHLGIYEWSFVMAAVIMTAVAVSWFILFKPHTRTDIKAPDTPEATSQNKKRGISRTAFIIIAGLAIFAVSNNFIKDGLQNWIPTILKETYDFSNDKSLILATAIYLFGISGSFIAKAISKRLTDHIIVSVILFTIAAALILAIRLLLNVSAVAVAALLIPVMICGYAINNVVTSLAPLSLRDELNPGVTAGVLDGFCYIGSAIATYALGSVADRIGWDASVLMLFITAIVASAVALLLKLFGKKKKA